MISKEINTELTCSHCGDNCTDNSFQKDEMIFCCNGCLMVFSLLHENGMEDYYRFEKTPGISLRKSSSSRFDYLDNDDIIETLLTFNEDGISKVIFDIPQIHCSSCLWLLENISMMNPAVIKSSVNFVSKKVTITFRNKEISLKELAILLSKIGYEPRINFDQLDEKEVRSSIDKTLIYKLGLAGFCFGNIMLLSFPEYLGFDKASYLFHIGYINIILAIPVLLYSGADYIKSAIRGIRMKIFNIDLPIALGMLALFSRSVYDILGHHGEGYLDSFAGFVFFLLIGRWFQAITYKALDFDRNYKSYFPISTSVFQNDIWISKSLDKLMPGNTIRVRNEELVPTDCILQKGHARIDYSFVTGESTLISKTLGEEVFAGGRHQGESIELLVTQKVDQSYLTQLWNEDTFKEHGVSYSSKLISNISKYFTFAVISLATFTMIYWLFANPTIALNTFTAVLIVACPCALALAIPFTYGNILRLLSSSGLFLRNVETIEHLQDIDYIIFDKTGTITDSKNIQISYSGKVLSESERIAIKSTCSHSSHPLSKAIVHELHADVCIDVDSYKDVIGQGFIASCSGVKIKVGSSNFIFGTIKRIDEAGVFIEIDGKYVGCFQFKHAFRENIDNIIENLSSQFKLAILSGDTDHERLRIENLVGPETSVYFQQSPKDKLNKIKALQDKGHKVMMIGDGLNDAGALKQADVGLVISDESNNFSPACDGIMNASEFSRLHKLLSYIRQAKFIIYGAFALAFLYNSIGLYFAMSGQLSPVIAAILMPLSSITVILYGVISSWAFFNKTY